jgi:hypothetical protein
MGNMVLERPLEGQWRVATEARLYGILHGKLFYFKGNVVRLSGVVQAELQGRRLFGQRTRATVPATGGEERP